MRTAALRPDSSGMVQELAPRRRKLEGSPELMADPSAKYPWGMINS